MRWLNKYFILLAIACWSVDLIAKEHTVTIQSSICGDTTCYSIADGATLTLFATPDPGCKFVSWNDGDTNNPRTVTITADATYAAIFASEDGGELPQAYSTNVSTKGCSNILTKDFYAGTSLTIEAIPQLGFKFKQWNDGNTQNPRMVSVTEAATYEAEFEQYANMDVDEAVIHRIQVQTEGCNSSYVTEVYDGAEVILKAQAVGSAMFSHWSDGVTDNPRIVTAEGDATYTAIFKVKDFSFSISENQKVLFSSGNLQYRAKDGMWRFAENQYDIIGNVNANIASTYDGWIDLFGWGTSGYHNEADEYNTQYQPYSTSTANVNMTNNRYGYGPSLNQTDINLVNTSANYDWGVYNTIQNDSDEPNQWRTLTQNQWLYLMNTRANAAQKWFRATVNNVKGVVLLPDEYTENTVPYLTGVTGFTSNTISAEDWAIMENEGAVFLPAAGQRNGTSYTSGAVSYHSTTARDSARNYIFHCIDDNTSFNYVGLRYTGRAVRLVKDVKSNFTISVSGENGTVIGGGTYAFGTTHKIQATPNPCYQFTQWSDGNTDNPRTILVTEDKEYIAIFEAATYNVNATTNDENRGKVSITQPTIPYVGFTATADNSSIKLQYKGTLVGCIPQVQYSYDGQSWKKLEVGTNYNVEKGQTIYMRGHNPNGVSIRFDGYSSFVMQGSFEGAGDLMTLVDSTGMTTEAPAYCFYRLFYYCTALTKAPRITATASNSDTYANMFVGCTNLQYIEVDFTKWNTEATENWVSSIASTGTFVKPTELSASYGSSYIPSGWTVLDKETNDSGTSNVTSGTYECETTLILTATPNDCYQFIKWSDGNTDNPRTVVVNEDATYTAEFMPIPYTITVESADESQGSVQVEIN